MSFNFSKGNAKKGLALVCVFCGIQPTFAEELIQENHLQKTITLSQLTQDQLTQSQINFSAQPANCIALRHGRTCYANVTLSWASPIKQDYCIYIKKPKNSLTQIQRVKCWKNSNGDQVIFSFESNKKIEFQLMSSKQNSVIAETAVDVSWVHEATPRKRRWRLF